MARRAVVDLGDRADPRRPDAGGAGPQRLDRGRPAVRTPICFENSFPSLTRAFVRDGAEFLVVPVNNASYGTTAASRAAPPDEPDPRGRERPVGRERRRLRHQRVRRSRAAAIVAEAGLFEPAMLRHTIRSSNVVTSYVRLGDWVPWLSLVFVARDGRGPRKRSGVAPAPRSRSRRTAAAPSSILPTYEERDTIEWVLARLLALPERVDVLVVDDSSPDGTGDLVARRGGRGAAGAAARATEEVGARRARTSTASGSELDDGYDLLVEMDSDLSHQPEELSAPARGVAARVGTWSWGAGTSRAAPSPTGAAARVGALEGRERVRTPDARSADPRRDERLPRLPARRAARDVDPSARSTRTATDSRSSW